MFIRRLWSHFYRIRCSIFSTFEVILSWSKVLLPKYRRKRSFAVFETCFMGLAVLNHCSIFRTLDFIFSWSKIPLQRYKRKHSFVSFETGFTVFAILFLAQEVILSISNVPFVRYKRNCSLDELETCCTGLAVLFLAHWRLFLVDWSYRCQYTGEMVHSLALKPFLRYLLFYY